MISALWLGAALAGVVSLPVGPTNLPDAGQVHPAGRLHPSLRVRWIPMWTPWTEAPAWPITQTEPVTLPAGPRRALVQVWHRDGIGQELGQIEVRQGGEVLARRPIFGRRFPGPRDGGLQEEVVDFDLPAEGPVEVAVYASARIWVGAIRLAPAAAQPVWVVEHCANTERRVDHAVAVGANAVELDVQWTAGGALLVDHPPGSPAACWLARTAGRDVGALLQRVGQHVAAGRLSLVVIDVKHPERDVEPFARALVAALDAAGLPARQVVLSVDRRHAQRFVEAVRAAPRAAPFAPWLDAWHDVATGARPEGWVEEAVAAGATFLSVGADPIAVHQPMPVWFDPLAELVNARDAGTGPARAMTWTLERKVSMRMALDLGLDAVIVNDAGRMVEVLREVPYAGLFRLGGVGDLGGRGEGAIGLP